MRTHRTTSPTARAPFADRLTASLSEGIAALDAGERLPSTFVSSIPDPPRFDRARLIALRERLRMSQASFAGLLNVSAKTVESWEQGVRAAQRDSRTKFACAS